MDERFSRMQGHYEYWLDAIFAGFVMTPLHDFSVPQSLAAFATYSD